MGFSYPCGNTEFEFQRMKVFSELQLEKGVDYSSIQYCVWVVTLFQLEKYWLVYWVNVKEWLNYTLTSQQFWKLTNNGQEYVTLRCMLQTVFQL